jgi:hypothetical protein
MLCDHGLNPKACLKCFHQGQAAAATSQPKPKPGHPYGGQNPAAPPNPIIAAVKARAGRMPGDIVPQQAGPVVMSSGVEVAPAPVQEDDRPKVRGKMPKPVQHQSAVGGAKAAGGGSLPQAFHYADDQGRVDSKGIWHPPKHKSIIDRAPRHPNANDKPTILR